MSHVTCVSIDWLPEINSRGRVSVLVCTFAVCHTARRPQSNMQLGQPLPLRPPPPPPAAASQIRCRRDVIRRLVILDPSRVTCHFH